METCPSCGKEGIKNLGSHKRFCPANEDKSPQIGTIKDTEKDCPKEKALKEPPAQSSEKQPKPINIVDVQLNPYDALVAWFMSEKKERYYKEAELIGRLLDIGRGESIPCVLVTATDGTILPPFMLSGFIGMYPKDHDFPDETTPDTTEPFPPFGEDNTPQPQPSTIVPTEPDTTTKANDTAPKVIIVPPGNLPAQELEEKRGILSRLFHGKQKTTEPPAGQKNDDMFEQLKNATEN